MDDQRLPLPIIASGIVPIKADGFCSAAYAGDPDPISEASQRTCSHDDRGVNESALNLSQKEVGR